MLKRFVLPIGVLVLLHGCAGNRMAQDLEERFSDPAPITARPVETDATTSSVPVPEVPEADDDPPQPKKSVVSDKPSARLSSEAAQQGFELGTVTNVDVLNALRDQFQAERDFQSARYEQIIALLTLKREAGTLNAGDLTEISRLMVPPDA